MESVTTARGRALVDDRSYTVVVNELLATGDRFPALRDRGRHRARVGTDLEALVGWLRQARHEGGLSPARPFAAPSTG